MNTLVVSDIMKNLRPKWVQRVADSSAHGAGVRGDFIPQLESLYTMLVQAAQTGDPSWLDQILKEWSATPSQSDLREGQKNLTVLLNRMIMTTYEISRDELSDRDAIELLGTLLPIFGYALSKASQLETESRVNFISTELVEVQKKMEKLDHTKSNFISVAAHELKTPLTLIEGYTAMIREALKSDQKEMAVLPLLEGVFNGVRRLHTIIDDMIDVSLIDNNLLSLNFQPIWLNNIFQLLEQELRFSLQSRNLHFEIKPFDGSSDMIFADPERIHQALKNILINAIKYTPDGGKILVDGRLLPGFVEITIADTGIGISVDDQDIIFSKFGQLEKTILHSSGKTKYKGGGPGLGLPIARGILDAHGGTIWVESDGHDELKCPGSVFHILLPFRTQSPDPKLSKLFRNIE